MKRAARGAPHLYYPNVRFSVRIIRVSRRPSPNLLCPRHLAPGRDHLNIVSPNCNVAPALLIDPVSQRSGRSQYADGVGLRRLPRFQDSRGRCRVIRFLDIGGLASREGRPKRDGQHRDRYQCLERCRHSLSGRARPASR